MVIAKRIMKPQLHTNIKIRKISPNFLFLYLNRYHDLNQEIKKTNQTKLKIN